MSQPSSQHGLTLIEVLIALVIIGVVFAALASSQISNIRITRASQETSVAMQLANRALELASQTTLENWSSYAACTSASSICTVTSTHAPYTVTYTIRKAGTTYALRGLVEITASVTGPVSLSVSQYLSCMDVSPPPTITNPGLCNA